MSLKLVWKLADKDHMGFLRHKNGVVFAACQSWLRIVTWPGSIIINVTFIAILLLLVVNSAFVSGGVYKFVLAPALVVGLFSTGRISMMFATLRIRKGSDTVDFPVDRQKQSLGPDDRHDQDVDQD
ncbi:MAG: hypothetical protein ABUS47_11185 [Steroidobacter sp.]